MSASVIEIDRVPLTFVSTSSPDRAERVSRRVRDAVARNLPEALASACGRELDADDAYVFIERLNVECAVGADWADDAVAAQFAGRLSRALLLERSLGRALVFQDRAELLTAFLAAAVEGRAHSRWWFVEFNGLSALPLSAGIRTLVTAEGPAGWEALARLSPGTLGRAAAALEAEDAEAMLAAVPAQRVGTGAPLPALIAALESADALPLPTRWHRLVASLVQLVRAGAGAASAVNLAGMAAASAIAEAARGGCMRGLPREATAATVLTWCEAAGLGNAERAAALEFDAVALVEYVVSKMPGDGESGTAASGEASFGYTPFGGALLLCVVLVRAGWWLAWHDALRADGLGDRAAPLAAWLALAVAARALAPDRPAAIEGDPLLRRVFGAPDGARPVPSDRETNRVLRRVLGACGPAAGVSRCRRGLGPRIRAWARALLAECSRRIPGCDGSSRSYLLAQCLSFPASVRTDGAAARLGRPPLDVLLVFSGLKRAAVTLPDGRGLSLSEEVPW